MLILSRKVNESLIIGDNVEVRIVDISSKSVKIGIVAPREVSLYRKEVYDAIKLENAEATSNQETSKDSVASLIQMYKKSTPK